MKRDMDLIRKIVLATADGQKIESDEAYEYHVWLLIDGGYLVGHSTLVDQPKPLGSRFAVYKSVICFLTWKGQDLADALRNEGIFYKVKEKLSSTALDVPLEVFLECVKTFCLDKLGLSN